MPHVYRRTMSIEAVFEDKFRPGQPARERPQPLAALYVLSADVIYAVDVMSRKAHVVYDVKRRTLGKPLGATAFKRRPGRVLLVELDVETDELERLIRLVQDLNDEHHFAGLD
jgi:hypothetical protein